MMEKNGIWVFCENGLQGVREVSYELLGAAAHLQHGVVPIGGTAGVVVAVTGKTITQKAALLSGVGRAGKARFFQDA